MKKSTVKIPSTDGKNMLNVVLWETEGQPKAVLQLVHGMAEYIERYEPFAEYLTENGYSVIGHDHLGHGKTAKSEMDLGYFASENGDKIIIDDMFEVTKFTKQRWSNVPNYILGHSMGSFCVRQYLTQHSNDVSGAIIMGTGWIPEPVAGFGKTLATIICKKHGDRYISKTLVKMSIGNNNKPFEPARTPVDWLSREMTNVDKYVADPYCGFDFTAGAYKDFFAVLEKIAKNKELLGIKKSLPVLVVSGENDPVGGKTACEKLVEQYYANGMLNVTIKLFKYDRHEILNEIDKRFVFLFIKNWLDTWVNEVEMHQNPDFV